MLRKFNRKKSIFEAKAMAAKGKASMDKEAYREAGKYYEKAASLLPIEGYKNTYPIYLNNAGYGFYRAGLSKKAQVLYERTLFAYDQVQFVEKNPYLVSTTMNNLASLYYDHESYEEAEWLYKEILIIDERLYDDKDSKTLSDLNQLALTYMMQEKYTQAESLYKRILAVTKEKCEGNCPEVTIELNKVATVYAVQGKYEQAESLYKEALAIYQEEYGEESQITGEALGKLATLYREQGDYKKAKAFYEKALALLKVALGEDDIELHQEYDDLLGEIRADMR